MGNYYITKAEILRKPEKFELAKVWDKTPIAIWKFYENVHDGFYIMPVNQWAWSR